jgi:hypothetical protein
LLPALCGRRSEYDARLLCGRWRLVATRAWTQVMDAASGKPYYWCVICVANAAGSRGAASRATHTLQPDVASCCVVCPDLLCSQEHRHQ